MRCPDCVSSMTALSLPLFHKSRNTLSSYQLQTRHSESSHDHENYESSVRNLCTDQKYVFLVIQRTDGSYMYEVPYAKWQGSEVKSPYVSCFLHVSVEWQDSTVHNLLSVFYVVLFHISPCLISLSKYTSSLHFIIGDSLKIS